MENPRDGGAWWAAVYGVAQYKLYALYIMIIDMEDVGRVWG